MRAVFFSLLVAVLGTAILCRYERRISDSLTAELIREAGKHPRNPREVTINLLLAGGWTMNGMGLDPTGAGEAALIHRDESVTMNGVMNDSGRLLLITPDGKMRELVRFEIPVRQSTIVLQASTLGSKSETHLRQ